MADHSKTTTFESDLLTRSLLYRQFRAQVEEINRHKWLESERAGHDIGFERALTDWTLKHRSRWLKQWCQEARSEQIKGES